MQLSLPFVDSENVERVMDFCDAEIFQEMKQGNYSRLHFLKGRYTQQAIVEMLLTASDTPVEHKEAIHKCVVRKLAYIYSSMEEEYKDSLRKHNDVVRIQLRSAFNHNNKNFSSFRSYNNYFWTVFGGRSLQDPLVMKSDREWYDRYCQKIEEHKKYCIQLLRLSKMDSHEKTMDLYERYDIFDRKKK